MRFLLLLLLFLSISSCQDSYQEEDRLSVELDTNSRCNEFLSLKSLLNLSASTSEGLTD